MTNIFQTQFVALAMWSIASFSFIVITRQTVVAIISALTFGLGAIAYLTCATGTMELGGLPLLFVMGLLGWAAALILRRRQGNGVSRDPRVAKNTTGWQSKRLLFCSLLGCGLMWGISIIFLVLPSSALVSFLRSIGGAQLVVEPSTEYAARMIFGAFTLLGFLFYVAASNIERHFWIIPFLGGLMVIEAIILGVVGARLKPDHPWFFESLSCLGGGLLILGCWFRLQRMLRAAAGDNMTGTPDL
jgi:hypothetical protein